jgi:hypothetical protein
LAWKGELSAKTDRCGVADGGKERNVPLDKEEEYIFPIN